MNDRTMRIIIGIVFTVFVAFAYSSFLVQPIRDDVVRLRRTLPQKDQRLQALQTLKHEQKRLADLMQSASDRTPESDAASLLSTIESVVTRLGLSERAISMRPMTVSQSVRNALEERLEIRFTRLGMRNVVDFIDAVESLAINARIDSLSIEKTRDTASMNLTISSLVFGNGRN